MMERVGGRYYCKKEYERIVEEAKNDRKENKNVNR
jgi:hypothetical protein